MVLDPFSSMKKQERRFETDKRTLGAKEGERESQRKMTWRVEVEMSYNGRRL